MPQLLTLSRAARLIGIKRSILQKKIQSGELSTFEGKLAVTELLRVYPDTKIEDTSLLERVERFKTEAVKHRQQEEIDLPTIEILATRIATLSKEFTSVKSELDRCSLLVQTFMQKLSDIKNTNDADLHPHVVALHDWLKMEMQHHLKL